MAAQEYTSWGRFPRFRQAGREMAWRSDLLPEPGDDVSTLLPYGNGRSYGDVCLNRGGAVVSSRQLRHFIHFDSDAGVIRCESGVLLHELLQLTLAAGWFLPVTPGTAYVTVGGAVANDVHGKNHHRAGTLGCHVLAFELLRSDGSRRVCSPTEHTELFNATIGGLGLTGMICWVELQLRRVAGELLQEESIKFANLDEFFRISDASDRDFEYTVAWIDCLAAGASLGRGLFARANHTDDGQPPAKPRAYKPRIAIPFAPPFSLVNKASLKAFNALYYSRQRKRHVSRRTHCRQFFYPLDAIGRWNLMYGPRGMLQYQCVLPGSDGREAIRTMLRAISRSGQGSFLAVLKIFGDKVSPGVLSFPRSGVTLALDFPNRPEVLRLLDRLDAITLEVNGAVYPAKDARMNAETFQACFPGWEAFAEYVDPAFSSSFWRRVGGDQL